MKPRGWRFESSREHSFPSSVCLLVPGSLQPAPRAGVLLKGLQRFLLGLVDLEVSLKTHDLQHLADGRGEMAQSQPAFRRLQFAVQSDELADRVAGKRLDGAEVEDQLAPAGLLHQTLQ